MPGILRRLASWGYALRVGDMFIRVVFFYELPQFCLKEKAIAWFDILHPGYLKRLVV